MLINIAKFQKRILSKCTLAKFHVSPEPDFVCVCLITILFSHTGRELISSHGPFSLRLAGKSEPVFLNVYGAQESIPRNEFLQPM
jgi:hypothetical protein